MLHNETLHYLDNAATTIVDEAVADAVRKAMVEHWANPSSLYGPGCESRRLLEKARAGVAKTLGASPEEVFFTGCGSESNNIAILGAALARKSWGKRVVVSGYEHPSVAMPMERLRQLGFSVQEIRAMLEDPSAAQYYILKRMTALREEKRRLEQLDRAEGTVRHPLEIWKDPDSGREKYIRLILDEQNARTVLNVVTEEGDHTYSWHSNSVSLDHYRAGLLLYQKP